MFTLLTMTLVMGAPVPPTSPPVPAGTAPRVLELKANENGKVMIDAVRTVMQKVTVGPGLVPAGAAPAPVPVTRDVPVQEFRVVELSEVKDLTITTADGRKLDKDEAIKKLTPGTIVVISGDGKPVSSTFLKV